MIGLSRLTDRQIDTAERKSQPYRLADGGGLYLLVLPSGAKTWRWNFPFNGKQQTVTFGQSPDVSTETVRNLHRAARNLLRDGIDPRAARAAKKPSAPKEEKTQLTNMGPDKSFETCARQWFEVWRGNKSNPKNVLASWRQIEKYLLPTFGRRQMDSIKPPELVRLASSIPAQSVARLCWQMVGRMYSFGIAHGFATTNPCAAVKMRDVVQPVTSRNFARVEEKDLPGLLRAIDDYRGSAHVRYALQMLALTALRTNELIGGRWDEVDWQKKVWRVSAERMKKKREHLVPLSWQAVVILKTLAAMSEHSEYIFPHAYDPRQPMGNNTMLMALYRLGYKGRMTGHGFRGIFSTLLNERDFDERHVEMQLAHLIGNSVSQRYNSAKWLVQRTVLMQKWADYLDRFRAETAAPPMAPGVQGLDSATLSPLPQMAELVSC